MTAQAIQQSIDGAFTKFRAAQAIIKEGLEELQIAQSLADALGAAEKRKEASETGNPSKTRARQRPELFTEDGSNFSERGKKFVFARMAAGLNNAQIAQEVGVTRKAIREWRKKAISENQANEKKKESVAD
jgi:DNA-binding XRE family transcriptional regulator